VESTFCEEGSNFKLKAPDPNWCFSVLNLRIRLNFKLEVFLGQNRRGCKK
jgi:hypothetical protein